MSEGDQQPAQPGQPVQQTEAAPAALVNPPPVIGDDQWNKEITSILTSNTNNALAELGFNPNVLRALKDADNSLTKLKAEKKMLEIKNRDLSAHLALANSRIDFSKQDIHSMWKEVIYYREKYHVLHRQHQEVLRAHSACSNGPPEQPYIHLVQELEKLQDMYRHILGQNTTLKFEVQRLTQQCVTAGLIPPPQNYIVTPAPALQLPAVQPGAARRASEPGVGQQQQPQVQYNQAAQSGQIPRQFTSPPSNPYATNLASNPAIIAGPNQAYNYHRTQLPQTHPQIAQLMPPPQPQGNFSAFQQQIPATRPRQVIDLTNSDGERAPKRPRMGSDPNTYTRSSPGPATHLQHQMYARMSAPAPYEVPQQRNLQSRARDHVETLLAQQYYSQQSGPTNSYQQVQALASSPHLGQYRPNTISNVPSTPTSASLVMDPYGQPRQMYTDPAYSANVASPNAGAGKNDTEIHAERSTGTPVGSTPAAGQSDPLPVSPRTTTEGRMHGEGSPLLQLTEEQTEEMRWEVADSIFTEPQEGDEMRARTCILCDHRREMGFLEVSPPPLLEPTVERMYSHLQAQHPESLEAREREWRKEQFGMDPFENRQQ